MALDGRKVSSEWHLHLLSTERFFSAYDFIGPYFVREKPLLAPFRGCEILIKRLSLSNTCQGGVSG